MPSQGQGTKRKGGHRTTVIHNTGVPEPIAGRHDGFGRRDGSVKVSHPRVMFRDYFPCHDEQCFLERVEFPDADGLARHFDDHHCLAPNRYLCPVCPMNIQTFENSFESTKDQEQHVRNVHSDWVESIRQYGETFINIIKESCPGCQESKSLERILRHFNEMHSRLKPQYQCFAPRCGFTCGRFDYRARHLRVQHGWHRPHQNPGPKPGQQRVPRPRQARRDSGLGGSSFSSFSIHTQSSPPSVFTDQDIHSTPTDPGVDLTSSRLESFPNAYPSALDFHGLRAVPELAPTGPNLTSEAHGTEQLPIPLQGVGNEVESSLLDVQMSQQDQMSNLSQLNAPIAAHGNLAVRPPSPRNVDLDIAEAVAAEFHAATATMVEEVRQTSSDAIPLWPDRRLVHIERTMTLFLGRLAAFGFYPWLNQN